MKRSPGIFAATFWRNPEITNFSRIFLLGLLGLVPAGYAAGKYYVAPESCIQDSRVIYAVWLGTLVTHSVYFWVIDRQKILGSFAKMLADRTIEIRKRGASYEVWSGDRQQGRLSLISLPLITVFYLVAFGFWCFHDSVLNLACTGQLRGSPSLALVMLGTSLTAVVTHEVLLWIYATMSVWKVSK